MPRHGRHASVASLAYDDLFVIALLHVRRRPGLYSGSTPRSQHRRHNRQQLLEQHKKTAVTTA